MKTYMAKTGEVTAKWLLVDATDQVLGRLSTRLARILMGKHRPEYTPHVDCGDFVVVINASKVKLTGFAKQAQRQFEWYTGYPGGHKQVSLQELMAKNPAKVVRESIRCMLPKTKLADKMLLKLKVYAAGEHPHQAQQPEPLTL
jgi:large subunit ribosomal protein L13